MLPKIGLIDEHNSENDENHSFHYCGGNLGRVAQSNVGFGRNIVECVLRLNKTAGDYTRRDKRVAWFTNGNYLRNNTGEVE